MVFRYDREAVGWAAVTTGLPTPHVNALRKVASALYAATQRGVFRLAQDEIAWDPINEGLADSDVLALAAARDVLYAGAWSGSIFQMEHGQDVWTEIGAELTP